MSASDEVAAAAQLLDFAALLDSQELARAVEEYGQRRKAAVLGDLDPGVVLRLALVPEWTASLAAAAFRRDVDDSGRLLADLERGGLLREVQRASRSPSGRMFVKPGDRPIAADTVHVITSLGRELGLGDLAATPEGRRTLARAMVEVASALAPVPDKPPATARWVSIALHATSPEAAAMAFDDAIEGAMSATADIGEVLRWIEVGEPIARLMLRDLQGALDLALARAARRIEQHRRNAADREHLASFIVRPEVDAAFDELLSRTDEGAPWALHLVGSGGSGKTMWIRYLAVDLAPRRNAVVARIDFDYISPDYPSLAPGLLIWAIMRDIQAQDPEQVTQSHFLSADAAFRRAHQRLGGARTPGEGVEDPAFIEGVEAFRGGLLKLVHASSPPRPVVLVLDTCEELTKLRADGTLPAGLEETFRILSALREGSDLLHAGAAHARVMRAPAAAERLDLRVVLAGRRLLAREGENYRTERSVMPPRPYLRLVEVRGFTGEEATTYLRDRMSVPGDYVGPVLSRCPDVAARVPVVWRGDASAGATTESARFSPFDLKLFADWVREEPRPSIEEVRAASFAKYVELRILRRLGNATLAAILPVLSTVGHFDRDLVRAIAHVPESELTSLWEDLLSVEWVTERSSASADKGTGVLVWRIDPALLGRLRLHFGTPAGARALRERAISHLSAALLTRDLATLDWTTFDAALRLLEDEPARAASLWHGVEERLFTERSAGWVLELLQKLTGSEGVAGERPGSPLHVLTLATFAEAREDVFSSGARPAWVELLQAAPRFPDSGVAAELKVRAMVGVFASSGDGASDEELYSALARDILALDPSGFSLRWALRVTSGFTKVLDADLEEWNRGSYRVKAVDLRSLVAWAERACLAWGAGFSHDDPGATLLAASVHALEGRARLWLGDEDGARSALHRAMEHTFTMVSRREEVAGRGDVEDPVTRVLLECALALYPALDTAYDLLAKLRPRLESGRGTDGDRLWSLAHQLALAVGQDEYAGVLLGSEDSDPGAVLRAACGAHRAVPPRFVRQAEALAALGDVSGALYLFRDSTRQEGASSFQQQQVSPSLERRDVGAGESSIAAIRSAQRVALRIAIRMRLFGRYLLPVEALVDSDAPEDRAALRFWQLYRGLPEEGSGGGDGIHRDFHAAWRTTTTLQERGEERARLLVIRSTADSHVHESSPGSSFAGCSTWLDLCEIQKTPVRDVAPRKVAAAELDVPAWIKAHPMEPAEGLILALRASALFGDERATGEMEGLARRLGARCAAEIAMDEAEHLALRLPSSARRLYLHARRFYQVGEDPVGAFLASLFAVISGGPEGRASPELRTRYGAARARVGAMSPRGPSLPSVSDLRLWSRGEGLPPPEDLPDGWGPVLQRLVLCLAAPQLPEAVLRWTAVGAGSRAGGAELVPVDLIDWLRPGVPSGSPKAASPALPTTRPAAAASAAPPAAGNAPEAMRPDPGEATKSAEPPLFFSHSPVQPKGSLPVEGPRTGLESFSVPRSARVTFEARSLKEHEATKEGHEVVVHVEVGRQRDTHHVLTTGAGPYGDRSFPRSPALADWTLQRGREKADIVLAPKTHLHAPPWEAVVAYIAVGELGPIPPPARFRRVPSVSGGPSKMPVAPRLDVQSLWARGSTMALAELGFREVEWAVSGRDDRAPSCDAAVFHVFGTPVETNAGLFWTFRDAKSERAKLRVRSIGELVEAGTLAAADIERFFPSASLCILHGLPLESRGRLARTDSDRMLAMRARTFAARVAATGNRAVIVLPPLSMAAAREALGALARSLEAAESRGIDALLDAVDEASRAILASSADHWESMYDVCLYAPDGWRLRSGGSPGAARPRSPA